MLRRFTAVFTALITLMSCETVKFPVKVSDNVDRKEMKEQMRLNPGQWEAAAAFLKDTDFGNIADGKYYLSEDSTLFANVQTYDSKESGVFETHQKYIDLQYVFSGEENIFSASLQDAGECVKSYSAIGDAQLFKDAGNAECLHADKSVLCIFLPGNLHKPGMAVSSPEKVRKVVIKVPYVRADGKPHPADRFSAERAAGTDLRILDDNIWQYDSENIPAAWEGLGKDPRDSSRCPHFVAMVNEMKPDVFTMQEYSGHMDALMRPALAEIGYEIAKDDATQQNFTPIYYNPNAVEVLECHYHSHVPEEFNNGGTKSYTSAVLRMKSTGKEFVVINTHLWWKSDKAQEGSTEARASQIRDILAEAGRIEGGRPVIILGDMNCEMDTKPVQQLLQAGYKEAWDAATVYGDGRNGHHICYPDRGFSAVSERKPGEHGEGCIDHFVVKGKLEVLVFERLEVESTLWITDHFPNYADIKLLN